MDETPYLIEVLLNIRNDGSTSVKESSLELRARESDLFLTSPDKIIMRGKLYKLMDRDDSDAAYLDKDGNPYKKLRYVKD